MIVILAHGTLGWWDELVFIGVIVIFISIAFINWFRSRSMDYEKEDLLPTEASEAGEERFKLE